MLLSAGNHLKVYFTLGSGQPVCLEQLSKVTEDESNNLQYESEKRLLGQCCYGIVFAILKTELIYRERFFTKKDAKSKIFDYIEMFYNHTRCHSSLGYKSPVEFEMMVETT